MIKGLVDNLKLRAHKKAYRRGFCWAMKSYYLDNMPGHQIEAYILGNNHPFDRGAARALSIINNFQGNKE